MRSLEAYRDKERWKKLIRRGMIADFSWTQSAVKYEQLYRQGLAKKGVKAWMRK
jgi:starch synthase